MSTLRMHAHAKPCLYATPAFTMLQPARLQPQRRRYTAVRAGVVDIILKPLTQSGQVPAQLRQPRVAMAWQAVAADRAQLLVYSQKRELNDGIANFYDESSELWESMWGEHMHHGYYPEGNAQISNQQAQIDMIERTLSWAGVERVSKASTESSLCPRMCLLPAVHTG